MDYHIITSPTSRNKLKENEAGISTSIFIAELVTVSKIWNQSKC